MPRPRHRAHHGVRSDDHQAIDAVQRDFGFSEGSFGIVQIAAAVGEHRLDDISDEGFVLHAAGRESGRFVAAPDDHVGGFFDFFDFVAVDDLLVAGEINGARSAARAAAGRWKTAPRCPVRRRPTEQFPAPAFRWACRWVPSGSPARRASAARTDRTIRPFRARWSKATRLRDRPTRRSARGLPCRAPFPFDRAAPAFRNSAADRTAPAGTRARPSALSRPLRRCSASAGPLREPRRAVRRSVVRSSSAGGVADGAARGRANAKPPDSPAWRWPSLSPRCRRTKDADRRRS